MILFLQNLLQCKLVTQPLKLVPVGKSTQKVSVTMGRPRKAVLTSKEKPSKKSCSGQADFENPLLSGDDACYQFI